jgi:mannose-6-phosphate isomerase
MTQVVAGRLHGVVQHYAWGSRTAIARLQGRSTPSSEPEAELWFGAHEQAPSLLEQDGGMVPLNRVIAEAPDAALGGDLAARGGARLPFLVKILAAAEPLSLQLHPGAADAAAGFATEEAAGVPRDAAARRYRDPWPKPEALVALEPFAALCGLRPVDECIAVLDRLGIGALDTTAEILRRDGEQGYAPAVAALLRMPEDMRRGLVGEVTASARRDADALGPVTQVVADLATRHPADPGVLAAVLLRHHALDPGEALTVAPGTPHAYLHGVGLEVMGASDNVLRGGLTPKHVDVDEFCRLLATDTAAPVRAGWREEADGERVLDAPGMGVRLSVLPVDAALDRRGPQILVSVEAGATVDADGARVEIPPGGAAFVPACAERVRAQGRVHRVTVGD